MKRLLLFSTLMLLFSVFIQGQSFELSMDDTIVVFDCPAGMDLDVINHGFVYELSGSSNNLRWKRNEIYLPENWGSAICDYERCYFQWVGERPLNLDPDQQSTFDLHLYNNINNPDYPGDPQGDSAVIEICVFEANDTTTMQCVTVTFVCDASSTAAEKIESTDLVISPNPTSHYFSIANSDEVGKIEVYNIIGAKLRTFDSRESTVYDVGELPSGIYLVRLYDKNDVAVLSTLRLKKR